MCSLPSENQEKLGEFKETRDVRTQDSIMESPILEVEVQFTSSGFEEGWFKRMIGMDKIVSSIDLHRTKPWVLLSLYSGTVSIWNYNTRAEEKSIKVDYSPVIYAKFVPEKHWIVVKGLSGFVCVMNYNTSKKLKDFRHYNNILCMEVHPTLPYVLTTSSLDKLIRLWDWENDWVCSETFDANSIVLQIAFNPKDPNSFATVSLYGIIKIWSLGSPAAKFTIDPHAKALFCVKYFTGHDDKLYILGGSDDCSIKIWDYESKTLVKTLEGHTKIIRAILVHPELPIILTGSEDIHIWNKNTYELLLVWKSTHGPIRSLGFIKTTGEVVVGCKNGMVLIKLFFGRRS